MALTDTAIRNACPGDKPVKLSDEKGLFLLLQPSGGKLWRLKYRIDGREKKLSLGRYPEVSLRDARHRRDEARSLLAKGIDPGVARKAEAQASAEATRNTFGSLGEEYLQRDEQKGFTQGTLLSCPLLSGPSTMTVWIEEGTTNTCEEAQARGDHR